MDDTRTTGYGSIDDVGDVDARIKRRIIPSGTVARFCLLPAALDLSPGKERINFRAECVTPGPYDGVKIDQAFFLGNEPTNPEEPFSTSYHYAEGAFTRVVAAILGKPVTDPEVRHYWSAIPRPDDSLESCARAMVEGLNRLQGKQFDSRTALKQDMTKGPDGQLTPKINPNTGEPYDPRVLIGSPQYPAPPKSEERAA